MLPPPKQMLANFSICTKSLFQGKGIFLKCVHGMWTSLAGPTFIAHPRGHLKVNQIAVGLESHVDQTWSRMPDFLPERASEYQMGFYNNGFMVTFNFFYCIQISPSAVVGFEPRSPELGVWISSPTTKPLLHTASPVTKASTRNLLVQGLRSSKSAQVKGLNLKPIMVKH